MRQRLDARAEAHDERSVKILLQWIVATGLALALPAVAMSQETPATATRQADSIPMLELARDPAINSGRVAAVKGTVGPDGLRFRVGELSILQPVTVMLLSAGDADDLTLSLYKKEWSNARRTGSTRGTGISRFEFRTQGGFNILLRGAAAETPFALLVWVGEELRPPMPDVVLTYDEFRQSHPAASASLGRTEQSADAGSHRSISSVAWIFLAIVGGGAAAFVTLRARGRRKQT